MCSGAFGASVCCGAYDGSTVHRADLQYIHTNTLQYYLYIHTMLHAQLSAYSCKSQGYSVLLQEQ